MGGGECLNLVLNPLEIGLEWLRMRELEQPKRHYPGKNKSLAHFPDVSNRTGHHSDPTRKHGRSFGLNNNNNTSSSSSKMIHQHLKLMASNNLGVGFSQVCRY